MPVYMKQHEEVKFVIVGGGPDKERLMLIARELGIEKRVIFVGEQPWDSIGKYYQLGDVFVSASQSETQGLTYIEAMAAGLPVVAKKDACLDAILIDGYNGFGFVVQKDLYDGLDRILYYNSDSCSGNVYSNNALSIVKSYSTEEFAKNILRVYNEVADERELQEEFL